MVLVKLEIRNECGTEVKNVKDILIDLGHARHSEKILEAVQPSFKSIILRKD